ncbi:CAP domain-containing protein [Rhizobium sp. KVB221]|uniref:CAP domain-containing protein n=1 Tax=Rhizobium setariae TaxID=2801340 RepID=A0A936YNA7_9HYPH|nr:CAP domain-containing protein [Rhizobium setariae]MBL0371852.1 CAP domain-containing protein [Rhizobium setariae]
MTSPTLINPTRRLLLGGFVSTTGLLVLSSCSTTTALAPIESGAVVDATEASLPMVNSVRRKKGLSGLSSDPVAASAAKDQAIIMSRYGRMDHHLGSDKSFLARMKRMDVRLPAAENIATGQDTVDEAVAAWIHSKKHLENMLGSYRGLGVAVARNSGTGSRPYWAMVLSNPDPSFLGIRGA